MKTENKEEGKEKGKPSDEAFEKGHQHQTKAVPHLRKEMARRKEIKDAAVKED